jgi:hypothetical protein
VKRLRSPVQGHSDESVHQAVDQSTNQDGKYAVLHLRFDKVVEQEFLQYSLCFCTFLALQRICAL